MEAIVKAHQLEKTFTYQKRAKGLRRWFQPEYVAIDAVRPIDLTISPGEIVAFVGPNGAGKSTTIKMLSGILSPSGGSIQVCGLHPLQQRKQLSYQIGTVFGQRSQLLPNLPLQDSLELFGRMYDLAHRTVEYRIAELRELFGLRDFLEQPVRQLSLGQRMRGEIAASLIHRPQVVFLDEPTIGLDLVAKRSLRQTLVEANEAEHTTIFLTSHDTGDIEALAKRTIIIDKGVIIVDESTQALHRKYLNKKQLTIEFESLAHAIPSLVDIQLDWQGNTVSAHIDMNKHDLNAILHQLLGFGVVQDIHIYNEPLEEVILSIYRSAHAS